MSKILSLFFNYAPAIMAFVSKWVPEIQKEIPVAISYLDGADKLATAVGKVTGATGADLAAKTHAVITTIHTDADILNTVLAKVTPAVHQESRALIDANGDYLPQA
jgi:hypothetical protein